MKLSYLSVAAIAVAASLTPAVAQQAPEAAELPGSSLLADGDWATDSTWGDGLVEKATYDAVRVIYGRPRSYEAVFLTNKEAHDPSTWIKSQSGEGVSVWKHNQIEVMPTPNYDYKHVTTSHLQVDDLTLTRLDASSQEWCGTSFHQFLRTTPDDPTTSEAAWDYFGFSYMPEAGRRSDTISDDVDAPTLPLNSLSLALRGYDFDARADLPIRLIQEQRSNQPTDPVPVDAIVSYAGETSDGHELDVKLADGTPVGTYTMAKDRMHVMLAYDGEDGQTYRLSQLDRVNYWDRDE